MAQEVVPGGDDALFGYWGFRDEQGRERAWVTKRKHRQSPPLFGDGSFQETIDSPEVLDLTRRLLAAFDYRGFAGVEFKQDPRDGVFRLMEINPRSESGNQLAISAGVDLPWIGYRYLLGELTDETPTPSVRYGVKFINEEWDLKSFLALRGEGKLTLRDWMRSLRGVRSFALGAWDDPMPFLVSAGRVGRAATRRALGRHA
jgi:predicted ATP-grasp superfamily ATP-dependent carboligase